MRLFYSKAYVKKLEKREQDIVDAAEKYIESSIIAIEALQKELELLKKQKAGELR